MGFFGKLFFFTRAGDKLLYLVKQASWHQGCIYGLGDKFSKTVYNPLTKCFQKNCLMGCEEKSNVVDQKLTEIECIVIHNHGENPKE